jgi:hypothetical protein
LVFREHGGATADSILIAMVSLIVTASGKACDLPLVSRKP